MSVATELEMNCFSVSTKLLVIEKKRYNNNRNAYRLDIWQEMKNRWMVFAVLFTVMMATITPKLGAPGGLLHLEYASYIPLSYIYFTAGQRPACVSVSWWTLLATVVHAHVVSPALCLVAVSTFRDSLDYRVIEGALIHSVGGGCPWLSLAFCECEAVVPAIFVNCAAAFIVVPLYSLYKCGMVVPPLAMLSHTAATLLPYCLGLRAGTTLAVDPTFKRIAALLLLYADCCRTLCDAEGTLDFGILMPAAVLVGCWAGASAAGAALLARCAAPAHAPRAAHALPAAAAGKGWQYCSACEVTGLGSLPAALLPPAQALILAAMPCPRN